VNDDDLVTRVPPGFRHAGTLIHFDEDGNVRQSADEAEVAVIESEALSESEFQEMQEEIRNLQTAISKHYGGVGNEEVEQVLEASIEGMLPSVSDHSLDRYIAHIRRFIVTDEIGLDVEQDQQLLKSIETLRAAGSPAVPTISDESPVLLRINNPNWKAPANLKIHSKFGTFVTVQATLKDLETLRKDPNVVSIEASRNAGFEELASSLPFIGADQIHRPPLTERGDSALIGIIDTGIDVLHDAFLDSNGKSRIFAIWNQRDSSGLSPNAINSTKFSQDYGTLYTASDIESFLNGTKAIPSALRDPAHHGTHVASIAAGRAVGELNDGLAPDAKIVVVIPNMKSSPGDPPSLGYSVSHVDALYFLKMASSGGNAVSSMALPMVVNVSLGMNAGAHDGTSALEAAFDSITRGGRAPGFVIVKSAGNERGHGGHARIRAAIASTPIEWTSTGFRFQDYFEVWYDALDELEFRLVDPAGNSSVTVDAANPIDNANLGGNTCQLRLTTLQRDNGDNRLVIKILPQTRSIQEGTWRLDVVGTKLASGQGYVDIWVERDSSRAVSFVIDEPKTTLSIPGTADTVISVGASNSSLPLALTSSSSYGPTRDNRPKPDIVAPGTDIRAAFSNQIGADVNSDHQATTTMTGTSMAAPHVAGVLALVLSRRHKQSSKPQYNARQLRKALIKYAKNSAGFHNEGYGWGGLNAAELFTKLT
jgi:endonuclease G